MRKLTILILISLCVLEAQTWQNFTTDNSPLPDNKINSITFGTDGTVWIATPGGLAVFKTAIGKHLIQMTELAVILLILFY